jgi:hypothetical protein
LDVNISDTIVIYIQYIFWIDNNNNIGKIYVYEDELPDVTNDNKERILVIAKNAVNNSNYYK